MSAPWLRNSAASSSSQSAASVWTEHVANDNRVYYWNSETKTSSWEKPEALKTPEERASEKAKNQAVPENADDWKEYETPDGKKYYHNANTNVTTWDKPETLALAEQNAQALRKENSRRSEGLQDGFRSEDLDAEMQELERTDRINMVGRDGKAITAAMYAVSDDAIPVFKTVEQAEEAFTKMLKKIGVQPDWTWSQTMRIAIVDPVWRTLPDTAARKATFERYLIDVKKATLGKQKDRIEKLRRNFDLMLRRHDEIKPYSQWRNVKLNLEGEVAYKAAIDDEEREALFDIYIEDLRERDAKETRQHMREAVSRFTELLRTLDINLGTTWHDTQAQLASDKSFNSDKQLQDLQEIDMLLAFQEYMRELERTHIASTKREKVLLRRQQRKNRESYRALLQQLRSDGTIQVGTRWKQVHDLIKDTPEYLAMLGQDGSSALDFFWDMCIELDQELRDKKSLALDVLESKGTIITVNTDVSTFIGIVLSDNRTSHYSESMLNAIFKQLVEKAQRKLDEERRNEERRVRRKQDDLRSAMKKLDPPIGIDDTYESARVRISMLAEFTALASEAAREEAFSKYIRRLKERLEDEEERAARRDRHSHRSPRGERRHHDRERRTSRDSRKSGGVIVEEKDGYESRRTHRSERRTSMSYDPRSPKRTKRDNGVTGQASNADGTPAALKHAGSGEDVALSNGPSDAATREIKEVEMASGHAGEESEEGEIAE